jgi:hypothetical protein
VLPSNTNHSICSVRPRWEHTFVIEQRARPSDLDEPDLCWIAGLLEGEGSFLKGPPSSPGLPAIQMVMVDRDVVSKAAELLGCRVGTVRPRRSHWKESYSIRLKGSRAVEWMRALRPLLGERRQGQIDRAIASYAPRSNQRLDEATALAALEMLAAGESVNAVARAFDVTTWCIYDLRLARTHKHLPRPAYPDGRGRRRSCG